MCFMHEKFDTIVLIAYEFTCPVVNVLLLNLQRRKVKRSQEHRGVSKYHILSPLFNSRLCTCLSALHLTLSYVNILFVTYMDYWYQDVYLKDFKFSIKITV